MGYYRPRPSEVKKCQHCKIEFESRHKRTMYCGESCRQLAYQARHRATDGLGAIEADAEGNLAFSFQNVGVGAAGAATAALGNYLLNDLPAKRAILSKLDGIEKGTEAGLNTLIDAAQFALDVLNIQMQDDPVLRQKVELLKIERTKQKLYQKLLGKSPI